MTKRLAIGILVAVVVLASVGAALFFKLGPTAASGPGGEEQAIAGQQSEENVGPEETPEDQGVEVGTAIGRRAPDFSLTDLDGKELSLSTFRGRPVILYFSAAWCPSCIPETETLARIKSEYGDRVDVIWIDVDPKRDTKADLRRLGREHGHEKFIYAFDMPDNEVAIEFRVRALGTTYILDQEGVVRYIDFGPTGYKTYARELEEILGAQNGKV